MVLHCVATVDSHGHGPGLDYNWYDRHGIGGNGYGSLSESVGMAGTEGSDVRPTQAGRSAGPSARRKLAASAQRAPQSAEVPRAAAAAWPSPVAASRGWRPGPLAEKLSVAAATFLLGSAVISMLSAFLSPFLLLFSFPLSRSRGPRLEGQPGAAPGRLQQGFGAGLGFSAGGGEGV